MTIDAKRLRELVSYDPDAGVFKRRVRMSNRSKVGDVLGTADAAGYIRVCVGGKCYYAHRLAWLYVYERWPECDLDHINRDKSDNRISNLRLCDDSLNGGNTVKKVTNTSGFKGVTCNNTKWRAQIMRSRRQIYLGLFETKEAARAAYAKAAREMFGEFARVE